MKKIKKLSIILGVLLLGVIVMSSNADAKKKKTKYIDLSKYVTFKVTYNDGFPNPHMTNYKKNSKFKYKGKKVTKKQFFDETNSKRDINCFQEAISNNIYRNGKKVKSDNKVGNYTWVYKFNTNDNKRYIIKKKYTIKESQIGVVHTDDVLYYSDCWLQKKLFKTDRLYIQYPYMFSCNANINIKCDYTPNNIKIINYEDYNQEYTDYKIYTTFFRKNNINSNEDLRNFVYNQTKDLGQICINKNILLKATKEALVEMDFKKLNPEMYNKINSRFEDGMFWRLVKPYITMNNKSVTTGKAITRGIIKKYNYEHTHYQFATNDTRGKAYSNNKEDKCNKDCMKMWPTIIDMADPLNLYTKYYS